MSIGEPNIADEFRNELVGMVMMFITMCAAHGAVIVIVVSEGETGGGALMAAALAAGVLIFPVSFSEGAISLGCLAMGAGSLGCAGYFVYVFFEQWDENRFAFFGLPLAVVFGLVVVFCFVEAIHHAYSRYRVPLRYGIPVYMMYTAGMVTGLVLVSHLFPTTGYAAFRWYAMPLVGATAAVFLLRTGERAGRREIKMAS